MKQMVLSVGKPKKQWIHQGCEEYLRRLRGYGTVHHEYVQPSKGVPSQAVQKEGKALLEKVRPGDTVVLLDEKGKAFSSASFSRKMESFLAAARGRVIYVVGGAYGLSSHVRSRGDFMLRLSDMTMTHELALLLLFEQLYRAHTIVAGHPYHH